MIAGPSSPGVGAPVNQPAGKPLGGTCMVPSAFRPRSMSLESTPIAAICRRTGTDLDRCAAATTGGLAGLDDRVGVGEDATEPDVAAGGGPAPRVWPEQPAVATAKMASRAAAPALTLE